MGGNGGDQDDFDFQPTLEGGGGEDDGLLAARYRIVRPLGEGGMGTVYLAKDEKLDGLLMAVKMLPTYLARNRRAMANLKREARITIGLSHPNIVTLRNFEETGDGVFLVMDYIDGRTLDDLLAEKEKLTEAEVVELFTPVGEALAYAHSKNVIHRDIKPGNILIATDGTPRLADFGVAREVKDTITRVTGKADTSGTLSYMSPEQLDGEEPTPQQDIYSLAATMYECLCGHPPFHRGDIHRQIANKMPPPPTGSGSSLEMAVMRCLAKRRGMRYENCRQFIDAIKSTPVVRVRLVSRKGEVERVEGLYRFRIVIEGENESDCALGLSGLTINIPTVNTVSSYNTIKLKTSSEGCGSPFHHKPGESIWGFLDDGSFGQKKAKCLLIESVVDRWEPQTRIRLEAVVIARFTELKAHVRVWSGTPVNDGQAAGFGDPEWNDEGPQDQQGIPAYEMSIAFDDASPA